MSTDLAALIQNNPSLVGTGVDDDTAAVAGGASGNKRISIKGSVFRKFAGGKEIGAIEDRHMNIIFVKMAHKPSRTFYAQGFKEGVKISPKCWSQDSETPDADVKNPVAASCKECPNSIKGSSHNGQGTACRLSWRTAVVLPNDPSGDVMQLVLPPTSCWGEEDSGKWPFKAYINMLAQNNISAGRVITKMQFDTKAATPKLFFSPVGVVPDADVPKVTLQSKGTLAENAIKLTVFQQDGDVAESPGGEEDAPKLREAKVTAPEEKQDVTEIVKKWSKKKEA
jgi:hypothetical protein